jgi:hypothetical protein
MPHRRRLLTLLGAVITALAAARPTLADEPVFKIKSVAFYLPADAIELRGPQVDAAGAYIGALKKAATSALAAAPRLAGVSASIVVGLKAPGRSRIWIVGGGLPAQRALSMLLKAPLEAVPAPPVTDWDAFAISFDAWDGGGVPPDPLPVPDEWRLAVQAQGGGMLPDDALKAVWP